MKTEDLVSLLSTGVERVDRRQRRWRLTGLTGFGIIAAFVVSMLVLKVNAHLGLEMRQPYFWIRSSFCLAVGAAALSIAHSLGLPGKRLGAPAVILVAAPTTIGILALSTLIAVPAANRVPLILGHTALVCPFLIAFLSAAPLAGLLAALRELAPTRLRWAGAAAGLAAGGFGALAYTLHCPELQPAFFGTWYVLGMVIPAGAGALLGPRVLRW